MCDVVDYSNWSNSDFPNGSVGSNQLSGATAGESCITGKFKRILSVSPSTPIGLPRKHLFQDCSPDLREITFGEDVEMVDLEQLDQKKLETVVKPTSTLNNIGDNLARIKVVGRRRIATIDTTCGRDNKSEQPVEVDAGPGEVEHCTSAHTVSPSMESKDNEKTLGIGISINHLKRKLRKPVTVGDNNPTNITARKNYKASRKKANKGGFKKRELDHNQRLIPFYFNKIVVGSENEAVSSGPNIE